MSFTEGMPITSASTDAQVEAAYDDNADFETDTTLTKVKAFMQACRILLRRRASVLSVSGRSIQKEMIQSELSNASKWFATMGGNTPRMSEGAGFVGNRYANPATGAVPCAEDCAW